LISSHCAVQATKEDTYNLEIGTTKDSLLRSALGAKSTLFLYHSTGGILTLTAMVGGVVTIVSKEVSDYSQALWLGEKDEAPLIYPEAIAATRALGGLRRLWLKIDATPQEYLVWEEVMDHWLLPRSRDYGKITCYTSALEHFDQTTTAWWKRLRYDMRIKG
jgi:hypothetical protein